MDAALPRVSEPEIFYALDRLQTLGAIREAVEGVPRPIEAFWDSLGVAPDAAVQRIARSTLTLLSSPGISIQHLADSLAALGLNTADHGDLIVTLVDDYLRPDLSTLNEMCLREERPWLAAKPVCAPIWRRAQLPPPANPLLARLVP